MNKRELIQFERELAKAFETGVIKCPIHLSGGNEDQLIKIFRHIYPDDYVFSTHRNHYHYLLHTNGRHFLMHKIVCENDSMHTCDAENNFYSSAIVAGCCAIACGVAVALKMQKKNTRVWCFVGDGALDEGWFYEAWRYAVGQDLPVTFVVEDNDRSVCTSKKDRWGKNRIPKLEGKIIYYKYKCKWSHVGIGKWVEF